jgi:polyisoprenyl-phosphate glycosyltransferase
MGEPSLDFVIPCYNEELGIYQLSKEVKKFDKFQNLRIIIVDNGSTDNTRAEIIKHFKESENLIVVRINENLGYGNGLKEGIEASSSEWVGWFHADLQVSAESTIDMITEFNREPSSMKGYRRNRSRRDRFFTQGMSMFCSLIFLSRMSDINGQPTIYRRSTLGDLADAPNDFSFDLFCLLKTKWAKQEIRRVKVDMYPRTSGQSSWNHGLKDRIAMSKRTMLYCFKLWGAVKFK